MPPRSKAQISKALEALDPPATLGPNQVIARVDKALGHARYACVLPTKALVTVDLDDRFRQAVWVERGNYVLLDRYPEKEVENGVIGRIVNIAKDEKKWRKMPYWPAEFPKFQFPESDDEEDTAGKLPPSDSEDES